MRNLPAEQCHPLECYAHLKTDFDKIAIKVMADPKITTFVTKGRISDGVVSEQSSSSDDVIN